MSMTPAPTPDPSDLPPDDADGRLLDAMLSTAGDSDRARHGRIERVLMAVDEQRHAPPGVIGRIRPLRGLVPAGLVAAMLIMIWVVRPGPAAETAQAAIVRVAASMQSVDHRLYEVSVLTADGIRLYGTVDVAHGDRFVSRFSPTGSLDGPVAVIAGSDGNGYWLVPPIGPVQVSDEPFGPLFPAAGDVGESGAPLLSLHRATLALQQTHDIAFAETDDPDLMRFVTTRRPDGAGANGISDLPVLKSADVIAERATGEVVQATFTLDQQFLVGNRAIRSITFELQRDAQAPPPEWYAHEAHHDGRPVTER